MTPAAIERATLRFVAQHLDHCATAVLIYIYIYKIITILRLCKAVRVKDEELKRYK